MNFRIQKFKNVNSSTCNFEIEKGIVKNKLRLVESVRIKKLVMNYVY